MSINTTNHSQLTLLRHYGYFGENPMLKINSSISRQVGWVFEKEVWREVVFDVTQLAKQLKAPEMKPAQVQVWPTNSSKKIMLLQGLIICNGVNCWGWIQHNTWIATALVQLWPFLHYMLKALPISLCSVLRIFDAVNNMGLQSVSSHRLKPFLHPCWTWPACIHPGHKVLFLPPYVSSQVIWDSSAGTTQPTMRSQILDSYLICIRQ